MDFIKYSEFLLRKLRERQQDLTQTLAAGGAQDFVQYQRIVGEISGLNFTEQEITALHGRMEDVEDD
jgi:hypothetical protein|tara:strand:+ start:4079 stop:4279 length:201 start_codon:yes stop_codon:yes gene_type:complete